MLDLDFSPSFRRDINLLSIYLHFSFIYFSSLVLMTVGSSNFSIFEYYRQIWQIDFRRPSKKGRSIEDTFEWNLLRATYIKLSFFDSKLQKNLLWENMLKMKSFNVLGIFSDLIMPSFRLILCRKLMDRTKESSKEGVVSAQLRNYRSKSMLLEE